MQRLLTGLLGLALPAMDGADRLLADRVRVPEERLAIARAACEHPAVEIKRKAHKPDGGALVLRKLLPRANRR